MTLLTLSLIVLACGWKFVKDWRLTRFEALKNSGHPQYFAAVLAGAYLACLSASLHSLLSGIGPYRAVLEGALSYLPGAPGNSGEAELIASMTAIAAISFFLGSMLAWLFNHFAFRDPGLLVAIARKVGAVDELEELCLKCLRDGVLLAITLKSGKVYVGIPEGYSVFEQDRKWVAVWPLASGFRDIWHRLVLNTYYQPHYDQLSTDAGEGGPTSTDFRVVIPRSEVQSAQAFDLPTYEAFQSSAPAAAQPSDNEETVEAGDSHMELDGADQVARQDSSQEPKDNTQALKEEILPEEDAVLLRNYFGFVTSVSLSILLLSGSALSVIFLGATLYYLARMVDARSRWRR